LSVRTWSVQEDVSTHEWVSTEPGWHGIGLRVLECGCGGFGSLNLLCTLNLFMCLTTSFGSCVFHLLIMVNDCCLCTAANASCWPVEGLETSVIHAVTCMID